MIELTRIEFLELQNAVLAKYNSELPKSLLSNNIAVENRYGFGNGSEYPHSLKNYILNNVKVASYINDNNITYNGKYLYVKYKEIAKNKNTISIKIEDYYCQIFLLFLNLDSFAAFRQEFVDTKHTYTKYSVWYYSLKRFCVNSFDMEIDYTQDPFHVIEKGFHKSEIDSAKNPVYEGFAERKRSYLYINLKGPEDDELKLISFISFNSNIHPKNLTFIRGILLGVSSNDLHPMTVECILLKEDNNIDTKTKETNILYISRYLMLQRHNFRVSTNSFKEPRLLHVKGRSINAIEHLAGTYRIWRVDKHSENIIQSKFVINSDYTSYLQVSYLANEKQSCLLNIHSALGEKLCVSAHPEGTIGIIAYAIFDIPPPTDSAIFRGTFSHVGTGDGREFSADIALLKDENVFVPQILTPHDVVNLINIDEKFEKFKGFFMTQLKI